MDEVGRAYDNMAEPYIELVRTTQPRSDDVDLIERHLAARPGTVLDAGCGPGHLTAHLRSLEIDVIGLDVAPTFISHARAIDPGGRYALASMRQLPFSDRSVAGILAWYSLIHVPPDELAGVLAELRRVLSPGGALVAGFFDGDAVAPFDHKVTTAYYWPVDDFAAQLQRAGFTEIERCRRPGTTERGNRHHAAISALATEGPSTSPWGTAEASPEVPVQGTLGPRADCECAIRRTGPSRWRVVSGVAAEPVDGGLLREVSSATTCGCAVDLAVGDAPSRTRALAPAQGAKPTTCPASFHRRTQRTVPLSPPGVAR